MSNAPFEFSFAADDGRFDPTKLPILSTLLEDWIVATYGNDQMVFGLLALDDDKTLHDIRIEAYGPLNEEEELITPHGEGSWAQLAAWMRELGVKHLISFVRRAPGYGHGVEVGQWDADMLDITDRLADQDGLHYQGHIILNEGESRIIGPRHQHSHNLLGQAAAIDGLMDMVDGPTRAAIGQAALARIVEMTPDIDPVVIEAVSRAVERAMSGDTTPPSDEDMALVDRAIEVLEQNLDAAARGELKLNPPTINPPSSTERPDVPPAFYN